MKAAVLILLVSLAILGTDGAVVTQCMVCADAAACATPATAPCTETSGACYVQFDEKKAVTMAGCAATKDTCTAMKCWCETNDCNTWKDPEAAMKAEGAAGGSDEGEKPTGDKTPAPKPMEGAGMETTTMAGATTSRLSWSTPTVIVLALVYSPLKSLLL